MTTETAKIRPFSNGSEFEWWNARNCDECTKQWDGQFPVVVKCDIEAELSLACIGDGLIPLAMWERAGKGEAQCSEFERKSVEPLGPKDYLSYDIDQSKIKYKEVDGRKRLVF